MTRLHLSQTLEPTWGLVRDTRRKVEMLLADFPEELRFAATMTTSELLENAVKYGCAVESAPRVCFDLCIDDKEIRIATANGASDRDGVDRVFACLAQLASAQDPRTLYFEASSKTSGRPASESSGLGLYRVVAEGKFSVTGSYEDKVLRLEARRKLG